MCDEGPRRCPRRGPFWAPSSHMRWRGLEPPRACAHKALNLARLPIPPPARGAIVPGPVAVREQPVQDTVFTKKSTATIAVRRVRLRSTMWVPPCDCGVNPMPPKPASRPECISTSVTSAAEISTWRTAKNGTIAAGSYQRYPDRSWGRPDDARATIQRLLVTGDNRLKQGVALEKVRESYLAALDAARAAGLEDAVRPLVELRLADLERLGASRSSSTRSACRLTSCASAARRAARFGRGRSAASSSAAPSASSSCGSTRTPASGGTNSGGPPTRVATTDRPEASPSSVASPNGSARLG